MKKPIWFDANNSPHVHILLPIIKELKSRGYPIVLTARHYSQTVPLMEKSGLDFKAIGKHGGKSRLGKLFASAARVGKLTRVIKAQCPVAGSFCHGSRELIIVSKLLDIPSMVMFDYEYTEHKLKNSYAKGLLIPSVIPDKRLSELGYPLDKIYRYPGLKENLYIHNNTNSSNDIPEYSWFDYPNQILVVLRPPSTESHYHNSASEEMLRKLFSILDADGVKTVILPRYTSQIEPLMTHANDSTGKGKFVIPNDVIDGPRIVRESDLCISGGGTMIREAAVVGTPAYSIFSGKTGAVDEFLEREGRMVFIRNVSDLDKLKVEKKHASSVLESPGLESFISDLFISNILNE